MEVIHVKSRINGLEYRARHLKKRFNEVMDKIPSDWIRVRRFKSNSKLGKANHIVITITILHNIPKHLDRLRIVMKRS